MRASVVMLAMAIGLAGCGQETPLSHALAAMRSGDAADFASAKQEAEDAAKTAWQPGMDRCKITADDIQKTGEVAVVEKMDHPELFKLSEEARFVYAVKVAGEIAAGLKGAASSAVTQALTGRDAGGFERAGTATCPDMAMNMMGGNWGEGGPGEQARVDAFVDWCKAFKEKYPDDAQYDAAMRQGAHDLNGAGFNADWPEKLQLADDENTTEAFKEERRRNGVYVPSCR